MQSIYDIQGKQLFCKTKFLAYRCGLAIVIAMCCMMENNNVAANEPMQVCDLLFGFCWCFWTSKLLNLNHCMRFEAMILLKPFLIFAFSF